MRELQLGEETGHAHVIGAVALSAGFLSKCAGEPGFPEPAFADHQKITFIGDPAACCELLEEGFVELALRAVIDILD